MVVITIKYGKKKFKKIEINSNFEDLQAMIFSLTNVPAVRQKIILKGKMITCSAEMAKLKNKSMIVVMGSADTLSVVSNENSSVEFVEDMTVAQRLLTLTTLPPGLHNLGNTCYLNSCLQCLKGIPALNEGLIAKVKNENNANANQNQNQNGNGINTNMFSLSSQLGHLFLDMNAEASAFNPSKFVEYFRNRFPRFASRNEHGFEQQDADEAYTELIANVRSEHPDTINRIFEGEFKCASTCAESEAEPIQETTEKFIKLQCFIDENTRHINDGIGKGLTEELQKTSSKLGRNAIWTKKKTISKLPAYVTVQLVRFYWKAKVQKNTKVLRRVVFPEKLDLAQFCEESLKKQIEKRRILDIEQENEARNEKKVDSATETETETTTTTETVDVELNDNDNVPKNESHPERGYYKLIGVVTHQGRSANSGHYIGYVMDEARNKWLQFDDENCQEVKSDDIKNLYGGGDWQMAFLTIYKSTSI